MALMNINSDINVLGGLPDFNLILLFLDETTKSLNLKSGGYADQIDHPLPVQFTALLPICLTTPLFSS
jgi:hypothetical protein